MLEVTARNEPAVRMYRNVGFRSYKTLYRGVEVPEHAHGAQWGVVLEGWVEFTIGGETQTYRRGDTYYDGPGTRLVSAAEPFCADLPRPVVSPCMAMHL